MRYQHVYLERKFGWEGLCIERTRPGSNPFPFRTCKVVAAIVGQTEWKKSSSLPRRFGGINREDFDNGEEYKRNIRLLPCPLQEVLERMDTPCD
jgi:hypothetical protein